MNSLQHGFAERGSGAIQIVANREDGQVTIRYFDDGIGLAETVRGQVFEPFFTTNRRRGSTGLGMHIVYNLVTQSLQGTIRAAATEDGGAEFLLSFPG